MRDKTEARMQDESKPVDYKNGEWRNKDGSVWTPPDKAKGWTAGPAETWRMRDTGTHYAIHAGEERIPFLTIDRDMGNPKVKVRARLIAAAPELAAMVQRMLITMAHAADASRQGWHYDKAERWTDNVDDARALLARVRGEGSHA